MYMQAKTCIHMQYTEEQVWCNFCSALNRYRNVVLYPPNSHKLVVGGVSLSAALYSITWRCARDVFSCIRLKLTRAGQ